MITHYIYIYQFVILCPINMYNYYVPKGEYISIYVYRMKGKNYMIISIDTENSFDKFNILS